MSQRANGMKRMLQIVSQTMVEHRINLNTFTFYISSLLPVDALPVSPTQFSCPEGFRDDIEHGIKLGKMEKAPWPDKIWLEMLRLAPELFASATKHLWKDAGRIGFVPSLFRQGLLAPIYKPSDASKQEKYHPITFLSVFAKLFTKVLVRNLRQAYTFNSNHWGLLKVQPET